MSKIEDVCIAICRANVFETGQGTCSLLCMDQLGDPRARGCSHAESIHRRLAKIVIAAMRNVPDSVILAGMEHDWPHLADARNGWEAMIDEALVE